VNGELRPLFSWRGAICDSDLAPTVRHVALTLSLHMNERGGSAFPSVERLAHETGLSDRTVQKALHTLVERGWLAHANAGNRGGRPKPGTIRTNCYEASVPKGEPASPFDHDKGEPASPFACQKGERRSPLRVNLTTQKGEAGSPEDVKNSSVEDVFGAKPTDDPVVARAHELAVLAFEQPVKPALRREGGSPFAAVLRLIEAELRSGRPVFDVRRAIEQGVDVWTVAGLRTAIAKARGPTTSTAARERAIAAVKAMGR
jgi:hypothetical protein